VDFSELSRANGVGHGLKCPTLRNLFAKSVPALVIAFLFRECLACLVVHQPQVTVDAVDSIRAKPDFAFRSAAIANRHGPVDLDAEYAS
jgi:hypothetical protein